jgi:hypothetical protein
MRHPFAGTIATPAPLDTLSELDLEVIAAGLNKPPKDGGKVSTQALGEEGGSVPLGVASNRKLNNRQ